MATITKRFLRDGAPRYDAQIRRAGVLRKRSFRTKAAAERWARGLVVVLVPILRAVDRELLDSNPARGAAGAAAGDVLYIPAGMPHGYRVVEAPFEFLCMVPNAPDRLTILE